ncbi:gliding-associated putative ABC transporter substrate-binding component GldG [Chryseolinea serpens]|uniref:Gliding-associated putative ABC transporter substrate-binding component GldG n=1 Tax=Chryseolinea serpens TaxID=947013 RepID=A0A1M5RSJ5_9BACT|nr:gliding motility-associated ABC transporter substrate-binding protein GldG [Chryseolinea serpens]SHH29312.1 gliding-associated putative ABC transporter substrate-binding component GldG [Chryseolinea serpens]
MVNWKSRKLGDVLWFANGVVALVLINLLVSHYFFRLDLTEEKRYSIKPQTKEILNTLEDEVYVEIFLSGDLNAGFTRFQKAIQETLEEFRIYSHNKIKYRVTDPGVALSDKARQEFMADLAAKGIQPTNVIDNKNGQRLEKIIFPGVVISYGGREKGVMLLKGNKAATPEEEINQSIEGIEYEVASAIHELTNEDRKRIGFVIGHGELDSVHVASLKAALREAYDVGRVRLDQPPSLQNVDVLVIAKPTSTFSTLDKFALDQYIMQGGKVMFLIDRLNASMDSASSENYFALPYELGLDDQLFKYGVRINPDLVLDRTCGLYPIITGQVGGKPQVQLMEWPFFPLLNRYATHPMTRNLDAVVTKFVSSVDTVKAAGIRKTPLMTTSPYSRKFAAPVKVSVNELRKNVRPEDFSQGDVAVGYLLEGKFTSLYKNRLLPDGAPEQGFKADGVATKLVVIGDGDLARNDINPRTRQIQALGFDPFTNQTFANRDFLVNAVTYLAEDDGLIQARNKRVTIRPLDKTKVTAERTKWQVINLVVPILLLIAYGVFRAYWRKKKFAKF